VKPDDKSTNQREKGLENEMKSVVGFDLGSMRRKMCPYRLESNQVDPFVYIF
jgi:hypothetical protein